MWVELKREDLHRALELTARISTKHHSLPVLSCILFEVENETLSLRATNLEVGITVSVPAKVKEKGVAAIPAQLLLQTVTLLSHPTITLKLEGDVVIIETHSSKTKIKTLPADEFPKIAKIEGKTQQLEGKLFSLGIKTVAFSVSQSAIKPELGSINVYQKQPHSLTFVGTDSFRLAEKTLPAKTLTLTNRLLIPQKNALELSRVIDFLIEDPVLLYTESQIALSFPSGVYITSRLVEANFPDYEQIIPKEYQTYATILSGDFLHALKKTNIFTNKFLQVTLAVSGKGELLLRSENTDTGTTEESIKAEVEGNDLTVSFNQQYLADPLQHVSDESVILSFAGIGRPLVLSGVSDKTFRYLVMPMNK